MKDELKIELDKVNELQMQAQRELLEAMNHAETPDAVGALEE